MITDSPQRYGLISQLFHWVMAFYLIRQTVGVIAGYVNDADNAVSHFLHGSHQPTGVIILVLVILRLAWMSTQKGHRPVNEGRLGQVASLTHALLYALMVLASASGLLLIWGKGKGLALYGVTLFEEGEATDWAVTLGSFLHTPLSWTLCVLIGLHILAALYHQLILRDRTLFRMLGTKSGWSASSSKKGGCQP